MSLTDEELNILDIGPSHPHYHRVARKAERVGGGLYAGAGSNRTNYSYSDVNSAMNRQRINRAFLDQIETERGRAAIAEPMIALGLDPSDSSDRRKYKTMISCAMGLKGHLDKIIDMENDRIYSEYEDILSGDRDPFDPTGQLAKRCRERASTTSVTSGYKDNSFECHRYRLMDNPAMANLHAQESGRLDYNRRKLYDRILGGNSLGVDGYRCSAFGPEMLKKALEIQVAALRPMPAYTPGESTSELESAGVDVDDLTESKRYQRVMLERAIYFSKFMMKDECGCNSCNCEKTLKHNLKNLFNEAHNMSGFNRILLEERNMFIF